MREVSCPSCGAAVKFVSAASLLAVCPYCRATLINRDLKIENIGKMGELLADPSPLQLGAEGKYRNVHFAVVGRIQVQYQDGAWNEWYLAFDDGRAGWLGEAGGTYSVSFESRQKVQVPVWGKISPGLAVPIGGFDYEVADVRTARVVGGEGELPFVVASGYEARVADLRTTTTRFATFDYSEDIPRVYLGESVEFEVLALRGLRDREQKTGPSATGKALDCSGCGAALTVRAPGQSLAVVCSGCGAILDAADQDFAVIQKSTQEKVSSAIPLGSRGRFKGNIFELVGFMVRKASSDGETYRWNEYVLFNPTQGFRWLSEYQGHWILSKPAKDNPAEGFGSDNRRTASYLGSEYRLFQTAEAVVDYVEGEFPWRVQVGEKAALQDYIAPPLMLSCEETASEKTWSLGEHLEGETVWKTFGLKGAAPGAEGVGVVQPSPFALHVKSVALLLAAFLGAAVLVQIVASMLSQNRIVYTNNFIHSGSGGVSKAVVTEPFELAGRRSNVRIDIDTDLSNRWGYFNMALISEETGQALNFGREVSYYFGSDSDGAWSEGNKRDEVFLPSVESGRYYLLVDPETDASQISYSIRVSRDVPRASYLLWTMLLLAVPPLLFWYRKRTFEYHRWLESDYPMESLREKLSSEDDD